MLWRIPGDSVGLTLSAISDWGQRAKSGRRRRTAPEGEGSQAVLDGASMVCVPGSTRLRTPE